MTKIMYTEVEAGMFKLLVFSWDSSGFFRAFGAIQAAESGLNPKPLNS